MDRLAAELDECISSTAFSGAVAVARAGHVVYERAAGLADRAHGVANALDTQFGTASATKTFTALTVMSLVRDGVLQLDTRVRSVLHHEALALIDHDVTVEHLLAHTSGIGDYLDEEAIDNAVEYVLAVPVHRLSTTAAYLEVLGGHPTKFRPGARFTYCNGGYVLLALIVEAVTGADFCAVVRDRVLAPAGMHHTAFLRSDQLPGTAAIGYVATDDPPGWRTNVLHLPVRGSGDGGLYSTVADLRAFWTALHAGDIVPPATVEQMTTPREPAPTGNRRYGLGFWLRPDRTLIWLEGCDAGVSCWSAYAPVSGLQSTIIANTADGAWPLARIVEQFVGSAS